MNGTIACLIAALGLLASASLAGQAAGKPAAPKAIRVLWIGNSYTAGGRLPELVAEMVNEPKAGLRMISKRALSGGKDWRWHYDDPKSPAVKLLEAEKFDFVCLQNQSAGAIVKREPMMAYAGKFVKLIRSRGGEPVFFCTWARSYRPYNKTLAEDWRQIVSAYKELAARHNARIAPAGPAWQEALKHRPDLPLHAKDGSHPAAHGAYLNACVFYATLTGKSPVGLRSGRTFTRRGPKGKDGKGRPTKVTIDGDTARFLQQTAWRVYQQHVKAKRPPRQGETASGKP